MTEREKVLLQREAVRTWYFKGQTRREYPWLEETLRRWFPLPPEKVPNVVQGGAGWEFRQNPETGRIESRWDSREWSDVFFAWPENESAVRAVIAEPYRLVSEEDTE